jgi:hypothetical protein
MAMAMAMAMAMEALKRGKTLRSKNILFTHVTVELIELWWIGAVLKITTVFLAFNFVGYNSPRISSYSSYQIYNNRFVGIVHASPSPSSSSSSSSSYVRNNNQFVSIHLLGLANNRAEADRCSKQSKPKAAELLLT